MVTDGDLSIRPTATGLTFIPKTSMLQNNEPPDVKFTIPEIEQVLYSQQQFFKTGVTRSFAFRKAQLQVLKAAIKRHENDLLEALRKDLGKTAFEAFGTEIGVIYGEINFALKHLRQWMQPKRKGSPLIIFPSSSVIYPQPLGMVLVISPWNYPVLMLLSPLISSIAAGNTTVLKPSELATETEIVLNTLVNETFEPEYIATVNGDGPMVSSLIANHHFDHVFFTGSTAVGSKVMQAAARQLSPVTLELGGKSPCIVAADASLDFAAKKIAWGKWINAGQTCVAPDYLLVHESVKEKLLGKLVAVTGKMFGSNPQESADYPRIINEKRWDIIAAYLQEGNIVYGGQADRADRYIAPTILDGVDANSVLMKEEIFGPVLPVLTYTTPQEALEIIEANPYPLACYIFTHDKKTEDFYTENIRFGGGCINNTLVHLGNPSLPFGGVGYSGMGAYHGKRGFDTFTHYKSMIKTPAWFDVPLWYPPYKDHLQYLRKFFK